MRCGPLTSRLRGGHKGVRAQDQGQGGRGSREVRSGPTVLASMVLGARALQAVGEHNVLWRFFLSVCGFLRRPPGQGNTPVFGEQRQMLEIVLL